MAFEWSMVWKWFKPTPKYFIPLSLATGFYIFASPKMFEFFQLSPLMFYGHWISVIFIVSCAFNVTSFAYWAAKRLAPTYDRMKLRWISSRALKYLSSDERRYLANCIIHDTKSWPIDVCDGIAASLLASRIIYLASEMIDIDNGYTYNLTNYIWKKLKKRPELLEPELSEERKKQKACIR